MRPLLLTTLLAIASTAQAAPARTADEGPVATRGSATAERGVRTPRDTNRKTRKKGKKRKGKKRVRIDEVSVFHGVFLYGPKLGTHDKYAKAERRRKPTTVKPKHLPSREVNRDDTLAVGLTAGSLMHGYQTGDSYGDIGLGLKGRYRPMEFVGIELGLSRHGSQLLGGDRGQTLISASGQLFAFPWNTLSPYASAGLTLDQRADVAPRFGAEGNLTGAHLGLGAEYTVAKNIALDVEARGIRWLNVDAADQTNPMAVQLGAGLVFHF